MKVALPQLTYEPTSQNHRVPGFEIPGDEQPRRFTLDHRPDMGETEEIIQAAYRQIFNEQQQLASSRLPWLESKLKVGQITVKEFVQGLLVSPVFRERNYEVNNNYRFVRICVQRVLGREVYSDREVLSWSIVLATRGIQGFVDELLNSAEYIENFGNNTVPYQRRRILPQHSQGNITFAHTPRYAEDYLTQLQSLGYDFKRTELPGTYRWAWQKSPYPKVVRRVGAGIVMGGATALGLITGSVVLSWFGWLHL